MGLPLRHLSGRAKRPKMITMISIRRALLILLALLCLLMMLGCGGGYGTPPGSGGGVEPAGAEVPVVVEVAVAAEVVEEGAAGGAPSACSQMSTGQGGSLHGFVPFPSDSLWNKDISTAPVDANSSAIINFIGANTSVHADFGAGLYAGSSMGIPYVIVGAGQAPVKINFTAYGDESDPGPMPIPASCADRGISEPRVGDRHVLVLDNDKCWLYEMFGSYPASGGAWNADQASVWDLLSNEQRPYTWTSADAAGLPIFPGLLRYDEVAAGQIKHAIRFTLQNSRAAFVPACVALGGELEQRERGAHGHARPPEGKFRHLRIFDSEQSHPDRNEEVRHDHGG